MLDSLGQRYGCLPSEILAKGDMLDIGILVKSMTWQNERDARNQQGQSMPVRHQYTTEELLAMVKKVQQ